MIQINYQSKITKFYIGLFSSQLIFIIFAALHRIELSYRTAEIYTHSKLLIPVFLGVLIFPFSIIFLIGIFFYKMFQRDWETLLKLFALDILLLILFAIAITIDAPTLIYMT